MEIEYQDFPSFRITELLCDTVQEEKYKASITLEFG